MGSCSSHPDDATLRSCDPKLIPKLEPSGRYRALVTAVYDGDTCTLIHRFGGELYQVQVRLLGIDAPELKPLLSTPLRAEVILRAKAARDVLAGLILNNIVEYETQGWDKYGGRVLGKIWLGGRCINDEMLSVAGVKAYGGDKRD